MPCVHNTAVSPSSTSTMHNSSRRRLCCCDAHSTHMIQSAHACHTLHATAICSPPPPPPPLCPLQLQCCCAGRFVPCRTAQVRRVLSRMCGQLRGCLIAAHVPRHISNTPCSAGAPGGSQPPHSVTAQVPGVPAVLCGQLPGEPLAAAGADSRGCAARPGGGAGCHTQRPAAAGGRRGSSRRGE
jgi:hypothetical protein